MTGLDVGAAPVILAVVASPAAARKLRRAGWWTCLMGYAVGAWALLWENRR